jgi:hypothetical protein
MRQAPIGLARVFDVLQCGNISLKATALQVLSNLCTDIESQQSVIAAGGLGLICMELHCHDDRIRRSAASLVRLFVGASASGLRRESLVDWDAVKICLSVYRKGSGHSNANSHASSTQALVEQCVLEYLVAMCSVRAVKGELVESGVLKCLLKVLDNEDLPAETRCQIVRALHELVLEPLNHASMLRDGLLPVLAKVCFGQGMQRRATRTRSRRANGQTGAGTDKDAQHGAAPPSSAGGAFVMAPLGESGSSGQPSCHPIWAQYTKFLV